MVLWKSREKEMGAYFWHGLEALPGERQDADVVLGECEAFAFGGGGLLGRHDFGGGFGLSLIVKGYCGTRV